jgi:hypothetical protein
VPVEPVRCLPRLEGARTVVPVLMPPDLVPALGLFLHAHSSLSLRARSRNDPRGPGSPRRGGIELGAGVGAAGSVTVRACSHSVTHSGSLRNRPHTFTARSSPRRIARRIASASSPTAWAMSAGESIDPAFIRPPPTSRMSGCPGMARLRTVTPPPSSVAAVRDRGCARRRVGRRRRVRRHRVLTGGICPLGSALAARPGPHHPADEPRAQAQPRGLLPSAGWRSRSRPLHSYATSLNVVPECPVDPCPPFAVAFRLARLSPSVGVGSSANVAT